MLYSIKFASRILIAGIAATLLSTCGQGGTVDGKIADARARNDGPAIWVARDHDSTLYLFGTVHLLSTDIHWQKDELAKIFRESGTVFFEVDTGPQGQIDASVITQDLGFHKDGRRLSDKLDSYQLKLLEAAANNGNISLPVLDSMMPWLAAEFLTLAAAQNAGLSADISADEALKSRAATQGKNIIYLDTIQNQILRTAKQANFVQMLMLTDALEGFDGLGNDLTRIAKAWSVGRTDFLTREVVVAVKNRSPDIYQAIYDNVNRDWVKPLILFLEDNGTGFVAIGTGHLLGEDSIQNLLREQGYEVERFYAFKGDPVIAPSPIADIDF